MIRTACLAATFVAGTLLPLASAGAAVSLNGRISQIVDALHEESQFDRSSFSFSVKTPGGSKMLFKGLSGVRDFNNFTQLNAWVAANAGKKSVYQGGAYQFTHGALGSYFGKSGNPSVYEGGTYEFTHSAAEAYFAESSEKSPYEGGEYKFTHNVLDSYFSAEPSFSSAERGASTPAPGFGDFASLQSMAAVPEPASWAMMIVGMGLAGAVMRRPRRVPSPA